MSASVEKQIRAELGSLTQNPTAHINAHHDSTAHSSGPAGILSTTAAQTIENHDSRWAYLFGIDKTALKIGAACVSLKRKT